MPQDPLKPQSLRSSSWAKLRAEWHLVCTDPMWPRYVDMIPIFNWLLGSHSNIHHQKSDCKATTLSPPISAPHCTLAAQCCSRDLQNQFEFCYHAPLAPPACDVTADFFWALYFHKTWSILFHVEWQHARSLYCFYPCLKLHVFQIHCVIGSDRGVSSQEIASPHLVFVLTIQ